MKKISQLFIIVIFAIFATACSDSNKGPEQTAEAFYKAIIDGNTDEVLALMDLPAEMKDPKVKEQVKPKFDALIKEMKKQIDQSGGIESIKAGDVTYSDDKTKANVIVIVKSKDGSEEKEPVHLIKVDGKWLVSPK